MNEISTKHPPFGKALLFWIKLGFISFGGPAGQVAIMHEYLVEKKKWISERRFMHALNYCMILPGPEAQQLATYIGWLLHGLRGGIAAGVCFFLPSAGILWLLSYIYILYGQSMVANSIFEFLKPAVIAIIVMAVYKIGKRSLSGPIHFILAGLAFAAIYFFNIPFPYILIGTILAGIIILKFFDNSFIKTEKQTEADTHESEYVINDASPSLETGFKVKQVVVPVLIGILLWFVPLAILYAANSDQFAFYQKLSVFFTQAALVTFGGAYAVLPYVAQMSVENFGWLSAEQMIDGLALGETTPGPLIMVLAFVGFMAGYNTIGTIGAATLGLVLTTFYTFLPSFLYIFAGAPLIERTNTNPFFKSLLGFITAAVTGVVLSLGIYFGKVVIIPSPGVISWISIAWILISFVAMQKFKVNMILWIGISIIFGLLKYLTVPG